MMTTDKLWYNYIRTVLDDYVICVRNEVLIISDERDHISASDLQQILVKARNQVAEGMAHE